MAFSITSFRIKGTFEELSINIAIMLSGVMLRSEWSFIFIDMLNVYDDLLWWMWLWWMSLYWISLCLVFICWLSFSECHYAECLYAESLYAECHYAKWHYTECHYAVCHYAVIIMLNVILQNVVRLSIVKNITLLTITIFFHIIKYSRVFNVYTIISNMCHLSQSVGAKLYFSLQSRVPTTTSFTDISGRVCKHFFVSFTIMR